MQYRKPSSEPLQEQDVLHPQKRAEETRTDHAFRKPLSLCPYKLNIYRAYQSS